jgi:hypothetical protein
LPTNNKKKQGSVGEAYAVFFFISRGYTISLPFSDTQRYDLIIEKDGICQRVEVKTSTYKAKGNYEFALRTNGGNQSGSGVTKRLSSTDCDLVFLYAPETGNAWLYDIKELEGTTSKTPDPKDKVN